MNDQFAQGLDKGLPGVGFDEIVEGAIGETLGVNGIDNDRGI